MTNPSLPRVGCGAAIFRNGQLLLVKRKRNPEAGYWGLPGGKVDPYETITNTAAREIDEELGIRIQAPELLCVVDQIDRAGEQHWVAPVFLVETFIGEPAIREPEALAGMGWFDLSSLPSPLTEATRQALLALNKRSERR
ncbi:NUDIX hydrolase [Acetobacter sp.]|jgi:ADP-ribose pyrophosphatase YjhB (NUDIX family)|uniref:NUDIX hydrolase n=1 Tax=Acetobacter sp. TaxID=440 RepID=UPI0025C367BA|nr:NUDIX domain-containing protein [Acetobacter sp.]MCH4091305.1 NUDIX domain-containing protein [Acetobacter sp.]MCI1299283.1 NUDIX domain-containing protein [Acetobacter sp.]MCI1316713.1 NUDIX domain-containing protein [Acetobacter sp.]